LFGFLTFVVSILVISVRAYHYEEGNYEHVSIEVRYEVTIPVQAYASDEEEQKINGQTYWPTLRVMIGFLLSNQTIPKVVDEIDDYRQFNHQAS